MTKRLISLLLILCTVCALLCACQSGEKITSEQAIEIVKNDLGDAAENMGDPHVHASTYDGTECYNIYITVEKMPFVYVISVYGDILHKGFSSEHAH